MAINERIVFEMPVLYKPNMQAITANEVVCGYARVSTDNEEQEDSYESQCEHFKGLIKSRSNWEFGGIYSDQGTTGTKAESRKDFMRMIEDCRAGRINRILVKSISRFARNTVDTLKYIRELKELGVSVYFETQNIDTMTPGGEILITILAAIAEQESRNMSTNIKWAFQKRFKEGKVLINSTNSIGYAKEGDGYIIVEEEAEIIRRIYRDYLSGLSDKIITERLTADGIKTPKGGKVWSVSTIQSILQNEKYSGNAILGKTFKPDVLSPSRIKNKGQAPSYYVENSHPAIISKEMFDMVQAERERRKSLRSGVKTGEGKYSSKYAFSGLLICAECGSKFRRYGRTVADGSKTATWVCITHQKNNAACSMLPLKEEDIYTAYKNAVETLSGNIKEIIETVKKNIEEELNGGEEKGLGILEEEIMHCQKLILELFQKKKEDLIEPDEYSRLYKVYSEKITALQSELSEEKQMNLKIQINRQRAMELANILDGDSALLSDENIMKLLIEEISVISKHEVEFQFKCGVSKIESI